jgi:hypothetical protein
VGDRGVSFAENAVVTGVYVLKDSVVEVNETPPEYEK